MKHLATRRFWALYQELPDEMRATADRAFALLKKNPRHPSLQFKKIGRGWSARVGISYRVLAVEQGEDLAWFWIGPHAEYDRLIRGL